MTDLEHAKLELLEYVRLDNTVLFVLVSRDGDIIDCYFTRRDAMSNKGPCENVFLQTSELIDDELILTMVKRYHDIYYENLPETVDNFLKIDNLIRNFRNEHPYIYGVFIIEIYTYCEYELCNGWNELYITSDEAFNHTTNEGDFIVVERINSYDIDDAKIIKLINI